MPELLVANPTYQHYNFNYRVPGISKIIEALIPAGGQVVLAPGEMDDTQLEDVIGQLTGIDAVPASEVARIHRPKTLVYSVRRPVSEKQINEARERDEAARQKVSDDELEKAGLAAFPRDGRLGARAVESTLEVLEMVPQDREEVAKGGVDTKVTVSRKPGAGKLTRSKK